MVGQGPHPGDRVRVTTKPANTRDNWGLGLGLGVGGFGGLGVTIPKL